MYQTVNGESWLTVDAKDRHDCPRKEGSKVFSPDIRLNGNGKIWVLNKVQYADERIQRYFEGTGWKAVEDAPALEK